MTKSIIITEIKYDDAQNIIPFSPKKGTIGCKIALRITLEEKKQLITVKFFVTEYGLPSTSFNFHLYSFSMENNFPTHKILNVPITVQAKNGDEWVEINLTNQNLILDKGDYFIAMEWLKQPGEEGKTAQTIGFAQNKKSEARSWMNWKVNDKYWVQDTGPYKGNFMIRAEVKNIL